MASKGSRFSSSSLPGKDSSNATSSSSSSSSSTNATSSEEAQAVVQLSMVDGEFNPQMKRGEYTFVLFSAPCEYWFEGNISWRSVTDSNGNKSCGHTETLARTWELLSSKYAGKVTVAEVDCSKDQDLCSRYKIGGHHFGYPSRLFPTLILFKDGKPVKEYQGRHDLKSLSNFIRKATTSPTSTNTTTTATTTKTT